MPLSGRDLRNPSLWANCLSYDIRTRCVTDTTRQATFCVRRCLLRILNHASSDGQIIDAYTTRRSMTGDWRLATVKDFFLSLYRQAQCCCVSQMPLTSHIEALRLKIQLISFAECSFYCFIIIILRLAEFPGSSPAGTLGTPRQPRQSCCQGSGILPQC